MTNYGRKSKNAITIEKTEQVATSYQLILNALLNE